MALVRCEDCGPPNGKKGNFYSGEIARPIGISQQWCHLWEGGLHESRRRWLLDWEEAESEAPAGFRANRTNPTRKSSCSMRDTHPRS